MKCNYCKKEIKKSSCYTVEYLTSNLTIKNKYYCDESCHKKQEFEKAEKQRLKELVTKTREMTRELLGIGSDKNIYFSKMYKDLKDTFGDELIYNYITIKEKDIISVLESKDFATTNSKVKYFFAMAQNQLEWFEKENNSPKQEVETEVRDEYIDDFEIVSKKKGNSNSVDDLLNNLF